MDSPEILSRDFIGIWIPKEIWLNPNISMSAKCLWAEIRSLYKQEVGGCYASEAYLSEFMGIQRRRFYELIQELTENGLLEKVSCDGRRTIRKALEPKDGAQQKCTKVHSSNAEKRTPAEHKNALPSYIENKAKRKGKQQHKNVAVDVFSSLQNLDIPLEDKQEISRRYSEQTVENAVGWATDPLNPPEKCLAASIKFACKKSLSFVPKKTKENPVEKQTVSDEQKCLNKQYVQEFRKTHWEIIDVKRGLDPDVEFARIKNDNLYYDNPKFREMFSHLCRKHFNLT